MRIDQKGYRKDYRNNKQTREDYSDLVPSRKLIGPARSTIDQHLKVMVLIAEAIQRLIPIVIGLGVGLIENAPDDPSYFAFILILIVTLIKILTHFRHFGQSPTGLGEIKHLPLSFGKRNTIPTCLVQYSADQILFCLRNCAKVIHRARVYYLPLLR